MSYSRIGSHANPSVRGLLAIALLIAGSCGSQSQSFSVELADVFTNLSFTQITDIQNASDGTNRLFVCEKTGRIKVFVNASNPTSLNIFLDISDRVITASEMGLLGLAFHPDFAQNGYFYLNYNTREDGQAKTIVSRMSVDAQDPNSADVESEVVLLSFDQPYNNHDGGQIAFGPDGYLYIATGDGGLGGDPLNSGQDLRSLLGKILRIDVDSADDGLNYAIPETNPFAGNSEYEQEIYAYGLRNPWRFSFDPDNGRLWAADVGQNAYEEIDIIEKGGNYGWRITEGWHCFNPATECDSIGLIGPVWEYGRSEGVSITGGYVYRGSQVSDLQGLYIYGDFGSGNIWGLEYNGKNDVSNYLIERSGLSISTFGVDEAGELFVGTIGGDIKKFVDPTGTVDDDAQSGIDVRVDPITPNPASDRVAITYSLESRGPVSIALFDQAGKENVEFDYGEQSPGRHTVEIDTSTLSSGLYYARLNVGEGQVSRRFWIGR